MRARSADAAEFNAAKRVPVMALTLSLLMWLVAFLAVGGEWFLMWQSQDWNGQEAAFRDFAVVGLVLSDSVAAGHGTATLKLQSGECNRLSCGAGHTTQCRRQYMRDRYKEFAREPDRMTDLKSKTAIRIMTTTVTTLTTATGANAGPGPCARRASASATSA